MTAPQARPGGMDGNARGLIVLVVALAVGFLLLLNAGGGSGGGSSDVAAGGGDDAPVTTADLGSTETTADTTTTTAVESGRAPSEVKVIVLNGGGPAGAAASTSDTIGSSGYTMGEAANSPVTVTATTFFYAEDYQADAIAVAALLGKGTDAVEPLEGSGLESAAGDATVVVVLGPDAPPVDSTTTTSAPG